MKHKGLIGLGAVVAAAALLMPASAAFADVWKNGTQNCTTNQTGVTRGYSTGTTTHYPPGGGGPANFYNGASWVVSIKSSNAAGGGSWLVTTDGSLSDPGTYAYCINGTP